MVRKTRILFHVGLINCELEAEREDSAIYRVQTANIIQWAYKVYHYNCQLEGEYLLTRRVKYLRDHLKIININPGFKTI